VNIIKRLLFFTLALFALTLFTYDSAQGAYNVIVIMTDDQESTSMWTMPKTNELLGSDGTVFTNSYVSNPLCCPSRATFVTGQYSSNNGVLTNMPPDGGYGLLDHDNTLPVWLQSAGYKTAFIGKWLNGYGRLDTNPEDEIPAHEEIPVGWDSWIATPGVEAYKYFDFWLNENGNMVEHPEYQTDLYAQMAVDYIDQNSADTAPFFLYISFTAPHAVLNKPITIPAARHLGTYSTETLPNPPSFNEPDISDKPSMMQYRKMSKRAINATTRLYRSKLEALLSVDDAVESIYNALVANNELENTIIIFTSDNGFLYGEHRVIAKTWPYEESIRVPLIIRHPAYLNTGAVSELVSNIDLAPTIVETAGASATIPMDGLSLLPVFQGTSLARETLLFESYFTTTIFGRKRDNVYTAVRDSRYITIERTSTGEREIYDLLNDPFQLENLW
jgi:N-acetylglucosamine-6-sulfatase